MDGAPLILAHAVPALLILAALAASLIWSEPVAVWQAQSPFPNLGEALR